MSSIYQAQGAPPGRLLGIEKRTIVPALAVALLFAVAVWVVPALNDAVGYSDPIRKGDVIQLGPAIEFKAATGWNLVDGYRQGDPDKDGTYPTRAALSYDGVQFSVVVDVFNGTPRDLIAQIKKNNDGYRTETGLKVTGDVRPIANAQGTRGAIADFDGTHVKGLVGAFVFGNAGVEVVVLGPDQVVDSTAQQVVDMLESVRPIGAGQ